MNEEEFDYLSGKRIEINSVKTKVGTEKLWEWIIYRLKEVFPNRNYNRAIEVPTAVKPDDLKAFYTEIENRIESCIECESGKIKDELTNIEGFIHDVPQKRIDIQERLKKAVINNSKYQDLMQKFNELIDSHTFLSESKSD